MCRGSHTFNTSALGARARVALNLAVLLSVALSGVALVVFFPPLWWVFTTYGWLAFPAAGAVARELAGAQRLPTPGGSRAAAHDGLPAPRRRPTLPEGGRGAASPAGPLGPFLETLRRRDRGVVPRLDAASRGRLEALMARGASFGWVVYGTPRPGAECLTGEPGDLARAGDILIGDPRASWYWHDPEGLRELGYHEFEPRLEAWSLRARTE